MEIDKTVLDSLPVAQRLKLLKQLRQEQVRRYNQATDAEGEKKAEKKSNKKKTNVHFKPNTRLTDAVVNYDDREGQYNFVYR
jgi:hypothetical protein